MYIFAYFFLLERNKNLPLVIGAQCLMTSYKKLWSYPNYVTHKKLKSKTSQFFKPKVLKYFPAFSQNGHGNLL